MVLFFCTQSRQGAKPQRLPHPQNGTIFIACTLYVKALIYAVIISFGDKATEDIYNGVNSKAARKIPGAILPVAQRKLDMLNAAYELIDLKIPPSNRLEKLKGNLSGSYSIRINEKYRIVFAWSAHNAHNVIIIDYH